LPSSHHFNASSDPRLAEWLPALAEFRKETLDDGQLEGSAMVLFAADLKADLLCKMNLPE
jgi:hypothetical protein